MILIRKVNPTSTPPIPVKGKEYGPFVVSSFESNLRKLSVTKVATAVIERMPGDIEIVVKRIDTK